MASIVGNPFVWTASTPTVTGTVVHSSYDHWHFRDMCELIERGCLLVTEKYMAGIQDPDKKAKLVQAIMKAKVNALYPNDSN